MELSLKQRNLVFNKLLKTNRDWKFMDDSIAHRLKKRILGLSEATSNHIHELNFKYIQLANDF